MFGNIISGIASLAGGLFGSSSSKKAAEANAALQREFAQHGVQWRVEDAKKAGIHPLYALGANTVAATPSYVGDTSFGSGVAQFGQDIGRAIDATRTSSQRVDAYTKTIQDLTVQNAALQNEQLAIQNAKLRQAGHPPPMSGDRYLVDGQTASGSAVRPPSPRQAYDIFGYRVQPAPGFSNAEDIEARHGEAADAAYGGISIPADIAWNIGNGLRNLVFDLSRQQKRHPARAFPSFFYK